MKKLLSRLIWAPLILVFVVFLVANRQDVAISFDPVSTETPALQTFALPLWVWLTTFLLIGFFLGIFAMWVSSRDQRVRAQATARALKDMERENQILAAQSTREAPLIVAEA